MSRPASSATDLRYQSTWVLAHSGATTSWPSKVAPSMAPCSIPSDSAACWSAENGSRASAAANSAVNTGSRLIRSIDGSSAASRRSSWMRCSVALVGSSSRLDRVLVGAARARRSRPDRTAPLNPAGGFGSGLMYHVSVGVPLSSPPQPSSSIGAGDRGHCDDPDPLAGAALAPLRVRRLRNRDTSAPLSKHHWPRRRGWAWYGPPGSMAPPTVPGAARVVPAAPQRRVGNTVQMCRASSCRPHRLRGGGRVWPTAGGLWCRPSSPCRWAAAATTGT